MKQEPEFQGQHKVSQVYLKQFGYEKDGEYWLSVYKAGEKETENVRISDFTKETNIFDLPFKNSELKRHFENLSNKIETKYRTVISNLHNQKRLTPKDKDVLNHFVANLMCRTNPFRAFIDSLLKHSDTRDKFISEMAMFTNNEAETKEFSNLFKSDSQLNVAIGEVMNHLVHVFRNFEKVIISKQEVEGWLTTDSPVHIDKQDCNAWVIPIEAEIYFPLSTDFCLFMFHPKSEINDNPLRNLVIDKINVVDFETFDTINKKIVFDYDEYLIMNTELEPTDVTGGTEKNKMND
jgi:Protein of unknown function (DUF4238)